MSRFLHRSQMHGNRFRLHAACLAEEGMGERGQLGVSRNCTGRRHATAAHSLESGLGLTATAGGGNLEATGRAIALVMVCGPCAIIMVIFAFACGSAKQLSELPGAMEGLPILPPYSLLAPPLSVWIDRRQTAATLSITNASLLRAQLELQLQDSRPLANPLPTPSPFVPPLYFVLPSFFAFFNGILNS